MFFVSFCLSERPSVLSPQNVLILLLPQLTALGVETLPLSVYQPVR